MNRNILITLIIVIIISLIAIAFLLVFGFEEKDVNTNEKSTTIRIFNDYSDLIDVDIEFEMYDYNSNTDNFTTLYISYKNISIKSGETWNYIFKAPESIDSQYLGIDLSVHSKENYTSFSHSSTWLNRRDDNYRIFDSEDGIDIEWLDKT